MTEKSDALSNQARPAGQYGSCTVLLQVKLFGRWIISILYLKFYQGGWLFVAKGSVEEKLLDLKDMKEQIYVDRYFYIYKELCLFPYNIVF